MECCDLYIKPTNPGIKSFSPWKSLDYVHPQARNERIEELENDLICSEEVLASFSLGPFSY